MKRGNRKSNRRRGIPTKGILAMVCLLWGALSASANVANPPAYGETDLPYQVEIEVIVADLSKDFSSDLGFVYRFLADRNDVDEKVRIGDSNILLHASDVLRNPMAHGYEGMDIQARILSVDFGTFQARLQAAVRESAGDILARPRIMTLDRIAASIQTGQDVPYLSRKSTDLSSTILTSDYVSTGVNMTVTPKVLPKGDDLDDDYIQLNLDVSVRFVSRYTVDSDQALPIVATRSAVTDVIIRDNHTFGIGGLYRVDYRRIRRSIPPIGRVPYVGTLFTSRNDGRSEAELVVFVTARIDRNIQYELRLLEDRTQEEIELEIPEEVAQ